MEARNLSIIRNGCTEICTRFTISKNFAELNASEPFRQSASPLATQPEQDISEVQQLLVQRWHKPEQGINLHFPKPYCWVIDYFSHSDADDGLWTDDMVCRSLGKLECELGKLNGDAFNIQPNSEKYYIESTGAEVSLCDKDCPSCNTEKGEDTGFISDYNFEITLKEGCELFLSKEPQEDWDLPF